MRRKVVNVNPRFLVGREKQKYQWNEITQIQKSSMGRQNSINIMKGGLHTNVQVGKCKFDYVIGNPTHESGERYRKDLHSL